MCIRDRPLAEAADFVGEPDLGRVEGVAGVLQQFGGLPGNPVSYTHLRAHETVLDLVCRLLLEKKKHKASSLRTRTISTKQE